MSEEQIFFKELPCGMELKVFRTGLGNLLEAHLTGFDREEIGAYFAEGKKNHLVIFVSGESLPALREAVNYFSPAPRKWYQFWKS